MGRSVLLGGELLDASVVGTLRQQIEPRFRTGGAGPSVVETTCPGEQRDSVTAMKNEASTIRVHPGPPNTNTNALLEDGIANVVENGVRQNDPGDSGSLAHVAPRHVQSVIEAAEVECFSSRSSTTTPARSG